MLHLDPEDLAARIERRAADDLADNRIGCAAVIVRQNGRVVYHNNFGTRAVGDDTPLSDGDLFRLASMTKPFTAVAVMSLVERGLLTLDTEVKRFLPAFAAPMIADTSDGTIRAARPAQTALTIRHLLTHTSGILNGRVRDIGFSQITREELASLVRSVDFYARLPLEFEPDTRQEYNAFASFDVAARIVEMIADEPFDEYLARIVFVPCDMTNTTFAPNDAQWAATVGMHARTEDGRSAVGATRPGCVFGNFPPSHCNAGAGLLSSLSDYSNFAEMLLAGGSFGGNRILAPESVARIGTPHVPAAIMPGSQRWGLGVRVITGEANRLPVGAFGWSGAYGTHFWVDPANRITAVYLKNSAYDGGASARTSAHFEEDVMAAARVGA